MRQLVFSAISAVVLAGCGSSEPPAPKPSTLVPVTGKVQIDGEPLEGAVVIFTPNSTGGFSALGYTDSTGKYDAETRSGSDIQPGAAPGSYRVMVSRFLKPDGTPLDPSEPPAMSAARESIPMQYSSPTDSKLRATIGSSGGTFDFNLKTKQPFPVLRTQSSAAPDPITPRSSVRRRRRTDSLWPTADVPAPDVPHDLERLTGITVGGSLGGLIAVILYGIMGSNRPKGPAVSVADELPPVAASQFLNTAADISFVGAARCAECHPGEHASYLQTAHSLALTATRPADEPPDGAFTHPPSGRSYEIVREDGQLWHREFLDRGDGSKLSLAAYPAAFTIGSGRFSRSYLMATDGFLVQSPATWYAGRPGWAISPGYDRYNPGFERPIVAQCVNCHVGRAELEPGTLQKFRFHSQAIDCERCHGPGAMHAERHAGVAGAGVRLAAGVLDATIVNPVHLPRTLQEEICAQCHFHSGATVELRGRRLQDFRPGLRLKDFCIHVARSGGNREMRVVGHVEQLRQSRCYQQSETLTCTTCHDPHRHVPPTEQIQHRRQSCLACHTEKACSVPPDRRLAQNAQDDCTSCHMPKADTEIPHFAFTHHRIDVHRDVLADSTPAADEELVALDDISHLPTIERDRVFGLAYLQLLTSSGSAEQASATEERARVLLEKVQVAGLKDPDVEAALARLNWRRDAGKTIASAQAVLQTPTASAESRVTALFTLGSTYLDSRQPDLAEPLLQELVRARLSSEDWFLLSLCLRDLGRLREAAPAAERAAQISPRIPQLQEHLANIYSSLGELQRADEHRERARQLGRHQAERAGAAPPPESVARP